MQIPVVYTAGKVGSSALTSAIHRTGHICFDIHTLRPERIKRLMMQRINKGEIPERHLIEAEAIRDSIQISPTDFKFITSIREPVGQSISAFFQNIGLFIADFDPTNLKSVDQMIDTFHSKYPLETPLTWFDLEIKTMLSVDIATGELDDDSVVTSNNGIRTLVLRADSHDADKEALLSRFVGSSIKLDRENEANKKVYSKIYEIFLDRIRFDHSELETIYGYDICQRFWSPAELRNLASKWAK